MNTKLLFICREGFGYAGWQRVEVWLLLVEADAKATSRFNISRNVVENMNGSLQGSVHIGNSIPNDAAPLERGEGCLFVMSGESFTLHDFADAVASEMSMDYTFEDGDEDNG